MTAAEFRRAQTHLVVTREELAKRLGISWRTVQRYATNETPIPKPVALLVRIWVASGDKWISPPRVQFGKV